MSAEAQTQKGRQAMNIRIAIAVIALGAVAFFALGSSNDGHGLLSNPGVVRVASASETGPNASGDKAWEYIDGSLKEASATTASTDETAQFGHSAGSQRLVRALENAVASLS
jgi:hypothetical protein